MGGATLRCRDTSTTPASGYARTVKGSECMSVDIEIGLKDTLSAIETKIGKVLDTLAKGHGPPSCELFKARVASDRRSSFFKDIWAALAVGSGIDRCANAEVTAWGLKDWSGQDDEDGFALSYPGLIALQRGARVLAETKPQQRLDAARVKRKIRLSRGVLGTGARQRTVVELDPDSPMAAALKTGYEDRDAFFEFVRSVLSELEIGALGRRQSYNGTRESPEKGTILEFLYELRSNAFEHGRTDNNVRLLRLQKHQYPHRDIALRHAPELDELADYLKTQPERPSSGVFNLVEASVSDFGPGILDGFLSTFAGGAHKQRPRKELLDALLHEQLSSKSSDPNAGLGIGQALAAAREIDAYVSLRTGEFWLTMRGRRDAAPRLTFREGLFPRIIGTHWQLLLPDRTVDGASGEKRA
jgi:hypothetical protein